jgi:hypothetical protein
MIRSHVPGSAVANFNRFIATPGMRVAAELNARNLPAPAGGPWLAVTVRRVLQRLSQPPQNLR